MYRHRKILSGLVQDRSFHIGSAAVFGAFIVCGTEKQWTSVEEKHASVDY